MSKNFLKGLLSLLTIVSAVVLSSCLDMEEQDNRSRDNDIEELKEYLSKKKISFSRTDTIYNVYMDTSKRLASAIAPAKNEYILANYNMRLVSNNKVVETNNHVLASRVYITSDNTLPPVSTIVGPVKISLSGTFLGMYYAMKLMKEGDSAVWVIPSDLAFSSYSTDYIPSYSSLVFEIKVLKVIKDPVAYDKAFWESYIKDSLGKVSPVDTTLANYADSTENGIYVSKIANGDTSQTIAFGNKVTVAYKGCLNDGRYFAGPSKFDTLTYNAGSYDLIDGFEEAIMMLNKGAKAKIFVPYYHAYGRDGKLNSIGQIVVPSFCSLYYEIEIVDIQ